MRFGLSVVIDNRFFWIFDTATENINRTCPLYCSYYAYEEQVHCTVLRENHFSDDQPVSADFPSELLCRCSSLITLNVRSRNRSRPESRQRKELLRLTSLSTEFAFI